METEDPLEKLRQMREQAGDRPAKKKKDKPLTPEEMQEAEKMREVFQGKDTSQIQEQIRKMQERFKPGAQPAPNRFDRVMRERRIYVVDSYHEHDTWGHHVAGPNRRRRSEYLGRHSGSGERQRGAEGSKSGEAASQMRRHGCRLPQGRQAGRQESIVEEVELDTVRCTSTDVACLKQAKALGKKGEIID